jgi:hypothetical protein
MKRKLKLVCKIYNLLYHNVKYFLYNVKMNIIQLYQDFGISYQTEGHKHCRPGWVNTVCPQCTGNPGLHLGYNLDDNYFCCYRCGYSTTHEMLSKLLKINNYKQLKEIISRYDTIPLKKEPQVKIRVKAHKLPSNSEPLQANHRKYLENRNFDPDLLIKTWGLLGTGVYSKLDNIDYKFRIIIPFIWDDRQVSFDSRDITGKDPGRYKACPKDRELIPHKEILYGKQTAWKKTIILVEGPTDVWRFGINSCAVSGIKYTPKQVRVIANTFNRVAVCFDPDPQARIQANKIIAELKFRGVDAFRVDIENDPGSMEQNDADYLVKQLMK